MCRSIFSGVNEVSQRAASSASSSLGPATSSRLEINANAQVYKPSALTVSLMSPPPTTTRPSFPSLNSKPSAAPSAPLTIKPSYALFKGVSSASLVKGLSSSDLVKQHQERGIISIFHTVLKVASAIIIR